VLWTVYILSCADHTLYTGITNDMDRRFAMHESGAGAKYTRGRTPLKIIYTESCPNQSSATLRERAIKAMKREQKITLAKTWTP